MFDIQGTLVSLDFVERFFCCDLDACLGACCIEGDAGAPLTAEESEKIKEILPEIWDDLLPRARDEIKENGVSYIDQEGELVTSIIEGKNCVFTCYEPGGLCSCAIEKAYRAGKIDFRKPISCYLYPARVKNFPSFKAVNYDRWKICKCAEVLGRKKGIRVYQFLKQPLIDRFGQEWYDELVACCELYIKQYLTENQ
ncbi:MAG: DUF3109 family protein [Bacteroidales bacterium]|nr:DUF3109 family protein [Candidatus Sodaliphilus aphodohippi]